MEITQCLVTGLPKTDGLSSSWILAVAAILVVAAIVIFSRHRIAALMVGAVAIGAVSFTAAPVQANADTAVCTASISGMAWSDTNGDGIRNDSEAGLSGVTVQLQTADGRVLLSKTVDSSGAYTFEGLPAGSYRVAFVNSNSNRELTDVLVGDSNTDSDATSNGTTRVLKLTDGQAYTHIDAGYRTITKPTPTPSVTTASATPTPKPSTSSTPSSSPSASASASSAPTDPGTAKIGNYVWMDDWQGEGRYDAVQGVGDVPFPGVTITLYGADAATVKATTVSKADGSYEFTGLTAGTYYIGVPGYITIGAWGWTPVDSPDGVDPELDSDINQNTNKSSAITLTAGEVNNSIDIGYWPGP